MIHYHFLATHSLTITRAAAVALSSWGVVAGGWLGHCEPVASVNIMMMEEEGGRRPSKREQEGSRHVKWDEEKLRETEKYRGQFAKIDEPKTPYRKNSESDEEMEEEEARGEEELEIEQSLQKAKANRTANTRKRVDLSELNARLNEELQQYRGEMRGEEEEVDEAEKERRREEFKKKRAMHYNEFKMIQLMKQQQWEDDQ